MKEIYEKVWDLAGICTQDLISSQTLIPLGHWAPVQRSGRLTTCSSTTWESHTNPAVSFSLTSLCTVCTVYVPLLLLLYIGWSPQQWCSLQRYCIVLWPLFGIYCACVCVSGMLYIVVMAVFSFTFLFVSLAGQERYRAITSAWVPCMFVCTVCMYSVCVCVCVCVSVCLCSADATDFIMITLHM